MKISYLLLFAAGMPLLAFAQADRAMPAVVDPNAPILPMQYQSVFADYIVAKEPASSPDKGWISANRALMGSDVEASKSDVQPVADASDKLTVPKPMHDQHEHKGAHQ